MKINLEFEDGLIQQLMAKFAGDSGEIGFKQFTELVMGSTNDDSTGWTQSGKRHLSSFFAAFPCAFTALQCLTRRPFSTGASGFDHFMMNEANFMVNIRTKIRSSWKDVKVAFGHARDKMLYNQVRQLPQGGSGGRRATGLVTVVPGRRRQCGHR